MGLLCCQLFAAGGAAMLYAGPGVTVNGYPALAQEVLPGDKLRIPANVPVKQYWALGIYDRATRTYIRKSPRVSLASNGTLQSNADGSIDVYFGPKAPAGQEPNWIYTVADREWFAIFRFYGPQKPLLEKTWRLSDIEELDPVRAEN